MGVSLRALEEITRMHPGMTTTEVCNQFLKPATKERGEFAVL